MTGQPSDNRLVIKWSKTRWPTIHKPDANMSIFLIFLVIRCLFVFWMVTVHLKIGYLEPL
jgi:hypothetical protein